MKGFLVHRIICYILIPVAILLTFNTLSGLLLAMSNPILLIVSFIMACVPLYIFCSSYFFFFGIMKAKPCKPSLKEWIKANAYVSIFFIGIMFLCSLSVLMILNSPELLKEVFKQIPNNQFPGKQPTPEELTNLLKIFIAIMLPFSILLLIHIFKTFRLLKLYHHVFDKA